MKRSCAGLLGIALIALTGCGGGGTPGGPGATNPTSKKPVIGQTEDTFNLDLLNMSAKVKQGEAKQVAIGIKRGKNFDEDVTLKFEDVPKGVTLEPVSPVIKHGDTKATLTLKVADDAALGDFTIKVTGIPTKGSAATNEFKITVERK